MSQRSRLDYAFAVGRVRALERYLLPKNIFLEAAEASDVTVSLKILYDAGNWPEELVRASCPEDIDRVTRRELQSLQKMMSELLEPGVAAIFQEEDRPLVMLERGREAGYPFFINYVRHRLDLGNIKIFLRFLYNGSSREDLEKYLLPGGFLDPGIFLMNLGRSFADLYSLLAGTEYGNLWERALLALEERDTFIVLEKEIENFIMNFLRRAKQVVFGPEPVFAYGMSRRREIQLVRLVIIGRMLHLPFDFLRERISETYV